MASISAVALTNGITLAGGESIIYAQRFPSTSEQRPDTTPTMYLYVTSAGNIYWQAKAGDAATFVQSVGFDATFANVVSGVYLLVGGASGNFFEASLSFDGTDPANPILTVSGTAYTGLSSNTYVAGDFLWTVDFTDYGYGLLDNAGNLDIVEMGTGTITSTITLAAPSLPSGTLVTRGYVTYYNTTTAANHIFIWATGSDNVAGNAVGNYSVLYTGTFEEFKANTYVTTEIVDGDNIHLGAIGYFPNPDVSITDSPMNRYKVRYIACNGEYLTASMRVSEDLGATWTLSSFANYGYAGYSGLTFATNTFILYGEEGVFCLSTDGLFWEWGGDRAGVILSPFTNNSVTGNPAITGVTA